MVSTVVPETDRSQRPLVVSVRENRPIQLPRQVTEALDAMRWDGETWEAFMWRVILTPRGYVRVAPRREGGEE